MNLRKVEEERPFEMEDAYQKEIERLRAELDEQKRQLRLATAKMKKMKRKIRTYEAAARRDNKSQEEPTKEAEKRPETITKDQFETPTLRKTGTPSQADHSIEVKTTKEFSRRNATGTSAFRGY